MNKDVRKTALKLLDNESTYPNEKKRKSISNKLRNTRNKTTKYLKNKGNKTSKFLKKKMNQTSKFLKKKRQNITQKVGNLRTRLFGKKNNRNSNIQINNWRKMYNRKTLNNKTLSKIKNNNFMGYNEMVHPFLRQQEEPTEARNMAMNSKKNNPYEYMYRPYGYMYRVNGPTSKHPPPPPPRSGRIVPDSEIKFNNYVNFSKNNEYGNSSNNNNENNNPENTTTLTL